PTHPRASEASLALARLTSVEARAQLNRARRVEVPPPPPTDAPDKAEREKERDAALARQRAEAEKSRPLFLFASKRFAEAAKQMKARLEDKSLDPLTRQALAREAFDADLASAVNQFHLADTFVVGGARETVERDKFLDDARDKFAALAKGPPTS